MQKKTRSIPVILMADQFDAGIAIERMSASDLPMVALL